MRPVGDGALAAALLDKVNRFNAATTAKVAAATALFALTAYLQ